MGGVLGIVAVFLFGSLFANVLLSAVAIAISPNREMGRGPYAIRIAALVVVLAVVGLAFGMFARALVLAGLMVVFVAVASWWTAQRLRNTGTFSKWWALTLALPVMGLLPAVLFMVLPPRTVFPSYNPYKS